MDLVDLANGYLLNMAGCDEPEGHKLQNELAQVLQIESLICVKSPAFHWMCAPHSPEELNGGHYLELAEWAKKGFRFRILTLQSLSSRTIEDSRHRVTSSLLHSNP
jgi:hypothetical protein